MSRLDRGLVIVARGNAAALTVIAAAWVLRGVDATSGRTAMVGRVVATVGCVVALDLWAARLVRRQGLGRKTAYVLVVVFLVAVSQVLAATVAVGEAASGRDLGVWWAILASGALLTAVVPVAIAAALVRASRREGAEAGAFDAEDVRRARAYQKRIRIAARLAMLSSIGLLFGLVEVRDGVRPAIDALPWPLALALVVTVVHVVTSAPMMALGGYRSLVVDRAFGLSTRSTRSWWHEAVRELAANGVVAVVGVTVVWTSMRLVEPRWPAAWVALVLTGVGTYALRPVVVGWVMPLSPADRDLQRMADDVARSTGTPLTTVLVAPMRERRAVPNAFVAGLGPFRRIIAFDVLGDLEPAHVGAVVAHEVGHVHHHHLARRLAIVVASSGVMVVALGVAGAFASSPWSVSEYPVFAAISTFVAIYASPFLAMLSRRQERQADAFALDATRDPVSFAGMIRAISLRNLVLLTPTGMATMGCTHPPVGSRIEAAARWEAAAAGVADD